MLIVIFHYFPVCLLCNRFSASICILFSNEALEVNKVNCNLSLFTGVFVYVTCVQPLYVYKTENPGYSALHFEVGREFLNMYHTPPPFYFTLIHALNRLHRVG